MDCPYCGTPMIEVFVVTNGGVWLSESREMMLERAERPLNSPIQHPATPADKKRRQVHCVIGDRGYRGDGTTWPKEGLYCENCYTFVVRPSL